MDPGEIPLELLTDGFQGIPEDVELVRTIKSPFQLSKALSEMRSVSLTQRVENRKEREVNFWIHDLVQYLYRQWQKPEERSDWAKRAIDVLNAAYPDTLGSLETWQKAKKYLKHGLACMEHAGVLEIQTLHLVDLMIRMSWYMRQVGELAMAEKLAFRGVIGAEVLGEGKQQHLNSISNLGLVYYHQSRFKEAREQWTKALEIGRKLLGSNYVDTGIGNQLALLHYQDGRFDEAEKLHHEIYERRMLVLKEHHPETLGAMGSLANTYHFQGRMEDAVEMKIRVLEGRRKHMSENHPETLGAMGSLATTFSDQGHLAEAKELQEEVMKGRKQQWGEDNPEFLSAKGALSYTFYLQKRFDKAEEHQLQILDARRKRFGDQHVETLGAMRHLGKIYYAQKRLDEAAELQEQAKIGMGELLGESHPGTLSCMEELSITYRDMGLSRAAKSLQEIVIQERERLWGRNCTDTIRAMEALSRKDQGFAH
jgi:tetratricopeptide (TPR) repeat protein